MSEQIKNIEKSRNTNMQIEWYQKRINFLTEVSSNPHAMMENFSVFATRQNITRFLETYKYWNLVKDVPGNIIECGVAGGNFLMSMAHFSSIYEPHHYTRKIIGFDTFKGFTKPSQKDLSSGAKHMKEGGLAYESYEYLSQAIELYDNNRMIGNVPKVYLKRGDISETLPEYLDENPAAVVGLLHLDLDLYKPTKDVIELLKKRIPRGGIIIFDEINHQDYPGETLAVMESLGIDNLRLKRVSEASMAAYVEYNV